MSSPLPRRFSGITRRPTTPPPVELAAQMSPAAAYTQTLFNRLLFVRFVSRKGWHAFNGNKDYLNT